MLTDSPCIVVVPSFFRIQADPRTVTQKSNAKACHSRSQLTWSLCWGLGVLPHTGTREITKVLQAVHGICRYNVLLENPATIVTATL